MIAPSDGSAYVSSDVDTLPLAVDSAPASAATTSSQGKASSTLGESLNGGASAAETEDLDPATLLWRASGLAQLGGMFWVPFQAVFASASVQANAASQNPSVVKFGGGGAALLLAAVVLWHVWTEPLRLISAAGVLVIPGCCFLLSRDRSAVDPKQAVMGIGFSSLLGVLILETPLEKVFQGAANQVNGLLEFSNEGAKFVFGPPQPTFAYGVLPAIIFFSALVEWASHIGMLPVIMRACASLFCFFTRVSPPEAISAAANIFVGMTNAPIVVKPFLDTSSKSQLAAIMAAGFATVAGSVLPAYIAFGAPASHLLAASFMGAPAALTCSKILVPETENPRKVTMDMIKPTRYKNALEAVATGVNIGIEISLGVVGMLIAFIAFVKMFDAVLIAIGGYLGAVDPLSLSAIFGLAFWPAAFMMGVPWKDCAKVASLLGKKTFINEFIAFSAMHDLQGGLDVCNTTAVTPAAAAAAGAPAPTPAAAVAAAVYSDVPWSLLKICAMLLVWAGLYSARGGFERGRRTMLGA